MLQIILLFPKPQSEKFILSESSYHLIHEDR